MAAFSLTAPDGTRVSVEGAVRRDVLLARGYTEGDGTSPSGANEPKSRTVQAKAGSNDTVTVNSETGKTGRK